MPNWCDCELTVRGRSDELKAFRNRVRSEERDDRTGNPYPLDFNGHVPEPPGLERDEVVYNRFPAWYEWRMEHWGTKWNAMYSREPRGSFKSGELVYRFATAYSPPSPWLDVVAAEHPKLYFELEFEIELGWGSGLLRWRRGKALKPKLRLVY